MMNGLTKRLVLGIWRGDRGTKPALILCGLLAVACPSIGAAEPLMPEPLSSAPQTFRGPVNRTLMLETISIAPEDSTLFGIDEIIDLTSTARVFSTDRLRPVVGRSASSVGLGNTGDGAQLGPDHAATLRQWGDWNDALQIQEGRNATAEIVQISPAARSAPEAELRRYAVANEVVSYSVHADHEAMPTIDESRLERADLIEVGNFAVQRQTGESHNARTVQVGWALLAEIEQTGSGHFAALLQQGFDNSAWIRQSGQAATALISQNGSGHMAVIDQSGERLSAEIQP